MAENLDVNQPIAEIDPVTKEIKATSYFETLWFNLLDGLGSEGGSIDHTLLANIGTKTHAQIDTHLALTDEHIDWTADQGATDINAGNYTDTNTTDHTAFSNIGSNTHAQIDTFIALFPTATTAQLEDVANAINTSADKILGYMVLNTTTGVAVFASGSADNSVWHFYDEATAHTPIA